MSQKAFHFDLKKHLKIVIIHEDCTNIVGIINVEDELNIR